MWWKRADGRCRLVIPVFQFPPGFLDLPSLVALDIIIEDSARISESSIGSVVGSARIVESLIGPIVKLARIAESITISCVVDCERVPNYTQVSLTGMATNEESKS
jgi:hypothetical protein